MSLLGSVDFGIPAPKRAQSTPWNVFTMAEQLPTLQIDDVHDVMTISTISLIPTTKMASMRRASHAGSWYTNSGKNNITSVIAPGGER